MGDVVPTRRRLDCKPAGSSYVAVVAVRLTCMRLATIVDASLDLVPLILRKAPKSVGASAMKVVTIDEMREIEHRAEAEHGLTSAMLMEYAGRSIAEILREHLGGDVRGLERTRARRPRQQWRRWACDGPLPGRVGRGDDALHLERAPAGINGQSRPIGEDLAALAAAIQEADVVADAFLGTGHSRPLDSSMGAALALVQQEKRRRPELLILAVDLPAASTPILAVSMQAPLPPISP